MTGFLLLSCFLLATPARGQFVVNDGGDLFDYQINDGICNVCRAFDDEGNCTDAGGCTLVAAIQNANLAPGLNTITFSAGSVNIDERNTPAITFPIAFDGTIGAGRVHVFAGPGIGGNAPGLLFSGDVSAGSSVRNMEISGFSNNIEFRNSSAGEVTGCYIHDSMPNTRGILASGTSAAMIIGGATSTPGVAPGNIIAGNGTGIELAGAGGDLIYGNLVGFDDGGQALGNRFGIEVGPTAGEKTHIGSQDPAHRNVVSNSQFDGIGITGTVVFGGGATRAENVVVRGNYIGTDVTGLQSFGNLRGITLTRTYEIAIGGETPAEGNLVSGNGDGVWLNGRADSTLLIGNTIGLAADGTPLPNENGIVIRDLARKNLVRDNVVAGNTGIGILVTKVNLLPLANEIDGNTIGLGADGEERGNLVGIKVTDATDTAIGAVAGNVIASNVDHGILIEGPETTGTRVVDNQIGVAADGSPKGNGGNGVRNSNGAILTIIDGNTIGSNGRDGIDVQGPNSGFTTIVHNDIGLGFGQDARGNDGFGIAIRASNDNLVEDNVIVKNTVGGVLIDGDDSIDNRLFANYIGTDENNNELGNVGPGVLIDLGTGNKIGGMLDGQGNTISFNEKGVVIDRGNMNPILRNSIVSNVLAAIDLGDDLDTANDRLDLDEGANDFQNFPDVVSYIGTGDSTFVEGVLSASPFQNYRLEFFADTNGVDLRVDAMQFVGFLNVSTDLAGDVAYLFKYKGVPEGVAITATDDFGNTSEFGLALGVIFGPNLTTDIEGDSLAIVNDDKEARVVVANRGTDLVEGVRLTIEWTDNLRLQSLVNDATEEPVDCPGAPAVCTVGDMNPTDLLRLRATFTGDTAGSFELSAMADGLANSVPVTSNRSLLFGSVIVGLDDQAITSDAKLESPYPNPFATSTTFTYSVSGKVAAELDVFDILGRRVHRIRLNAGPGEHAYRWDGRDDSGRSVGAGLYFVRLSDAAGQLTRSVVRSQ